MAKETLVCTNYQLEGMHLRIPQTFLSTYLFLHGGMGKGSADHQVFLFLPSHIIIQIMSSHQIQIPHIMEGMTNV